MTNKPAPKPPYVVDTNIFMDWQARHYPAGVFVSLLSRIDELISNDRFIAPALVQEEIDAVETNDLIAWANLRPQIWVPNESMFSETMAVQGQFPDLLDPKAEFGRRMLMSSAWLIKGMALL